MLALMSFLVLSQFESNKLEPLTLEQYEKVVAGIKADHYAEKIKAVESRIFDPAKIEGSSKMSKLELKEFEAEWKSRNARDIEDLKARASDEGEIFDLSIVASSPRAGSVGILTTEFVRGTPKPATVKVIQVLEDDALLAEVGDKTLYIAGAAGQNLVDGDEFRVGSLFYVSGRYSYTSVSGARRTIHALHPWPHRHEWKELKAAKAEAALKAKAKAREAEVEAAKKFAEEVKKLPPLKPAKKKPTVKK